MKTRWSLAVLTVALAWTLSQVSPAWANRYLAIALPPFLLLAGHEPRRITGVHVAASRARRW